MNATRLQQPGGLYRSLGHVLAAPALTLESPFLDLTEAQVISDPMYEWLPQQILSLLKEDDPFVVVYAYGQSLKPADRSIVTAPGPFFGMCTNYQITGEAVTKTALHFEERRDPGQTPFIYRANVESFQLLSVD